MNFGLEDMKNNTILGTPTQELSKLKEDLKKDLDKCKRNKIVNSK